MYLWILKGNVRNILKIVNFLCDNARSKNILFFHKTCSLKKKVSFIYSNTIFKDQVLFK